MEKNLIIVDNRICNILRYGEGGPIFIWAMFPHQGNEIEHMEESLNKFCPKENLSVAAFQVEDWNRDLSPWEAPAAFGDGFFGGKAGITLKWLTDSFLPYLKEKYGERNLILMGYSLAGLFALWAAYEMACFDGIISGSGSLWFPKWDEYVATHKISKPCNIYLSLGRKEEKTRNQTMAQVGNRTRTQEEILKADPNVHSLVLEWNNGGHFADSAERLCKGINWMLEELK